MEALNEILFINKMQWKHVPIQAKQIFHYDFEFMAIFIVYYFLLNRLTMMIYSE